MAKVLLTGATGFIGRHCLPLLTAGGWEVHAVSSRPIKEDSQSSPLLCWHEVDLFDAEQTRTLMAEVKPEYLLHLAWCSTAPGGFWTTPENFRWVQASLGLLDAFAGCGGKRVVLAGTCAEYDWTCLNAGEMCDEASSALKPATVYGTCKHALQLMLEAWAGQMNVSAAWGRVFFLYGPHEHPNRLVPATIRALLNGVPARCSSGLQIRDFLHVQDAAAAFVALLQSEATGTVNIASGRGVAVKDVANCIGDILGRRDLIELGALATKADEPPFLVGNARRLETETGWAPIYDLEAGLRATVNWWQNAITSNCSEETSPLLPAERKPN